MIWSKPTKNNRGFTLMEMVLVLAVIAILAMMAMPSLSKSFEKTLIKEDARQLRKELFEMRQSSIQDGKVKWGNYYGEDVVFYPNGRTRNSRFRIVHDSYYVVVTLRGFTGRVIINRPKRIGEN